jgi:serine/threonine protein kinase
MLGRYQVLRPLAKGGMAEVLLARSIGIKGFERFVVLKRILLQHENEHSIEMFLDEARLVAGLHHRNVVQVHDIGEEEGKYFFAMEYVHGEDVRALLRAAKDKKQQIPIEHVLAIVTAAATGLHYAHEQKGPDKKPLGIVHRDISPGNILIGFDGSVKVVDFGIAKTETQQENTQAGEMKGKIGYMSPEQCEGKTIDRRTDVFMLGIVLFELCTVRRLFKGETKFDTMQAIVKGDVPPPTKFRKDLPEELEKIILKALAPDPADRYQTADDLRLVLEAFAMRNQITISSTRLSDYMKDLFGERPLPWLVEELPPMPDLQMIRARESQPVIARQSSPKLDAEGPSESTPMAWSREPDARIGKPKWFWPTIAVATLAIAGVVAFFALDTKKAGPVSAQPQPDPAVRMPANVGPTPPPPSATPDASTPVEEHVVAAPPVDAGVEEIATPDAAVDVATKPTKPTKPIRRPIRRRPPPPGGNTPPPSGGDDLDNPFPK